MTARPAAPDQDWAHLRSQVRRMLGSRLGGGSDAEDVVQEVLMRVLRNGSSLRDSDRFGAWLSVTARNAVADELRARRRHPLRAAGEEQATPPPPHPDAGEPQETARNRLASALRPFAERLPSLYREVIILSELEEVPHAEIARRLSISISGVKSRVQRGRDQLRKMLIDCCEISLDARRAIIDCVPRVAAPAQVTSCCPPGGSPGQRRHA